MYSGPFNTRLCSLLCLGGSLIFGSLIFKCKKIFHLQSGLLYVAVPRHWRMLRQHDKHGYMNLTTRRQSHLPTRLRTAGHRSLMQLTRQNRDHSIEMVTRSNHRHHLTNFICWIAEVISVRELMLSKMRCQLLNLWIHSCLSDGMNWRGRITFYQMGAICGVFRFSVWTLLLVCEVMYVSLGCYNGA